MKDKSMTYYERNKERCKTLSLNRYYQNKDSIIKYQKNRYNKNKNQILSNRKKRYSKNNILLEKTKEYQRNLRKSLFSILGEKCVRCGFSDIRALQFDHIEGGGTSDLISFGNAISMYRYYVKNPNVAKKKLQTLCANCNWIKKHENLENPN